MATWADGTKKVVFFVEHSGKITWTPSGFDTEFSPDEDMMLAAFSQLQRAVGQEIAFPDAEKGIMDFWRAMADSGHLGNKEDGTPIASGDLAKIGFDWSPSLPEWESMTYDELIFYGWGAGPGRDASIKEVDRRSENGLLDKQEFTKAMKNYMDERGIYVTDDGRLFRRDKRSANETQK